MFLKRATPRDNPNINDYHNMTDSHSPIKISSQMVMNPNLIEKEKRPLTNEKNNYPRNEDNQILNNNYNNNYYKEGPLSQSYNVEAERRNRLLREQKKREFESPKYSESNTDYYYKNCRTSSDINDYNNRYTYNYRRDFDYIDFNKLSKNQEMDEKYNVLFPNKFKNGDKNYQMFEKPFPGLTPKSRQRSCEVKLKKKGSEMEPFYKFKNVELYGQRDPVTFGYDEVDDKYRYYSHFRNDYQGSRYGSYTYNYYLNAPMRGDISEDFKYPPQYYYRPKNIDLKPVKNGRKLIKANIIKA